MKSEVRSQKSEVNDTILVIKNVLFLFSVFCFLFSLMGCDAFVRKFTRKPKKENLPVEEMVVAPIEYKSPVMSKEELYHQYFLYWKSWHGELIESLSPNINHKKQIDCARQAISNLEQLPSLLDETRQDKLNTYINQLKDLKDLVTKDIYGTKIASNRVSAERIKRDILRDFSYNKIKNYLK